MSTMHKVMAVLVGLFCLAYDVWLVHTGLFQPVTIVPLVAWMAFLVWCCRRAPQES